MQTHIHSRHTPDAAQSQATHLYWVGSRRTEKLQLREAQKESEQTSSWYIVNEAHC